MEATLYALSIASAVVTLGAGAVSLRRSQEGRALELRLIASAGTDGRPHREVGLEG